MQFAFQCHFQFGRRVADVIDAEIVRRMVMPVIVRLEHATALCQGIEITMGAGAHTGRLFRRDGGEVGIDIQGGLLPIGYVGSCHD